MAKDLYQNGAKLAEYLAHMAFAYNSDNDDESNAHFAAAQSLANDLVETGAVGTTFALFMKAFPTVGAITTAWQVSYGGTTWLLENTQTGEAVNRTAGRVADKMLDFSDAVSSTLEDLWRGDEAGAIREKYVRIYTNALNDGTVALNEGVTREQLVNAVRRGTDITDINRTMVRRVPKAGARSSRPTVGGQTTQQRLSQQKTSGPLGQPQGASLPAGTGGGQTNPACAPGAGQVDKEGNVVACFAPSIEQNKQTGAALAAQSSPGVLPPVDNAAGAAAKSSDGQGAVKPPGALPGATSGHPTPQPAAPGSRPSAASPQGPAQSQTVAPQAPRLGSAQQPLTQPPPTQATTPRAPPATSSTEAKQPAPAAAGAAGHLPAPVAQPPGQTASGQTAARPSPPAPAVTGPVHVPAPGAQAQQTPSGAARSAAPSPSSPGSPPRIAEGPFQPLVAGGGPPGPQPQPSAENQATQGETARPAVPSSPGAPPHIAEGPFQPLMAGGGPPGPQPQPLAENRATQGETARPAVPSPAAPGTPPRIAQGPFEPLMAEGGPLQPKPPAVPAPALAPSQQKQANLQAAPQNTRSTGSQAAVTPPPPPLPVPPAASAGSSPGVATRPQVVPPPGTVQGATTTTTRQQTGEERAPSSAAAPSPAAPPTPRVATAPVQPRLTPSGPPAAPPTSPSPEPGRKPERMVSATSGVELEIGTAWGRDKNCKPLAVTVTVTRGPSNGHISVVDATVIAAQVRVGSPEAQCGERRQIAGKKIMYRSNPGFHGTDTVTYSVTSRVGTFSSTVTVNVGEGPGHAAPSPPSHS